MSKHVEEVFADEVQDNFVALDTTTVQGRLRIEVQDQLENGTTWLHEDDRYIVVSDVHGTCHKHRIPLQKHTGSGSYTLPLTQGSYTVYEEVDDSFDVQYYVDGKLCSGPEVIVNIGTLECVLTIVRRKKASAVVTVQLMEDVDMGCVSLCLHHESGMTYPVVLQQQDNFCAELCLPLGCYRVEVTSDTPDYALYFDDEQVDDFVVCGKHHTLCVALQACCNTSLTISLHDVSYIRNETVYLQLCASNDVQEIQLDCHNDYCVQLQGLNVDEYVLQEACEHSEYAFSFRVNGNMEEANACFCLQENEEVFVEVLVTPREDQAFDLMTPLKICKVIRQCDGMVCKPQAEDVFRVLVQGCGMKETFLLNVRNNFCVELADVCPGMYEVQELGCQDYFTTYQVNDDIERTSACFTVEEGCATKVTIINEMRNKGNIRIGLYVQAASGELLKPEAEDVYIGSLRSWANREEFVLEEANDWCIYISDLSFGSYEIRGCSDASYDVSYIVNGVRQHSARFCVEDGMQNEVRIIWTPRCTKSGVLKIAKYEQTDSKQLVKPSANERFMVEVCGENFQERYLLHQGNSWCIQLEGLAMQEYRIMETASDAYDVSYIVNQEWCHEAVVCMDAYDQEVCIINQRKRSGTLTIDVQKEDCDGNMMCPQPQEQFHIVVEGVQQVKYVCLDERNNWCATLHDLPMGPYRIVQQDDCGYHVSYCINGQEELFARVHVGLEDMRVTILNKEMSCSRQICVQAYVQNEDGTLCLPPEDAQIPFVLFGEGEPVEEVLCAEDGFSLSFDDVMDGCYEIEALDTARLLCYRVQEKACDFARFHVDKENVQVDMIFTCEEIGMLRIDRKICQGSQSFQPPYDKTYRVSVTGEGFHEVFALYEGNDFCVTLHNMPLQQYEIKELYSDHIRYEVNGYAQHHGHIELTQEGVHVSIVEEETLRGCMEIRAWWMQDQRRCTPSYEQCFEVLVESECYRRKIVLDQYNGFCVTLYDLPSGHYEVKTLDDQHSCGFEINGILQECAVVDLYDQDVCIALLYEEHCGCLHFQGILKEDGQQVSGTQEVYRILVSGEKQYQIQLDQHNHFQASLQGLAPGYYQITEVGQDAIRFEVEGQVFEDMMCVELENEQVCIDVVRSRQLTHTLTVHQWVTNANQEKVKPASNQSFQAELRGEHGNQQLNFSQMNNFQQTLSNLPDGMYELVADNARVQVEDGSLEQSGLFNLHQDLAVNLVQFDDAKATLRIRCRVEENGQLQSPQEDDRFVIEVTQNENQLLTFDNENGFRQKVWLHPQVFELLVIEASGVLKGYQYDGTFTTDGMFTMPDDGLSITCIFTKEVQTSSLTLKRVVRNPQCDCLQQPLLQTSAVVRIYNDTDSQQVVLNRENGWTVRVDDLQGRYTVEEVGNPNVSYQLDEQPESTVGQIQLQNVMHTVTLIEDKEEKGSIDLCRLIKDENGKYVYPTNDEEYWITLRHKGEEERILLNGANHYYVSVRNLEDGWYDIVDEQQQALGYIVNNANMTPDGRVHVMQNQNTVNIICDCHREKGSITLAKYIRRNGCLQRPKEGESFVFRVSKENYNRLFTLNEANGWMLTISDLDDGMYVVCESAGCDRVTYMINGGSEVDCAVVCVQGNSNTVEIINAPNYMARLHMEKFVRVNGQLQKPSANFVAQMQLTKAGFQQTYTLRQDNGWSVDVDNLEKGIYVLTELNQQHVSYIIDGKAETSDGVITLQEEDVSVMIVNTPRQQNGSIRLEKYFQQEDGTTQLPSEDFTIRVRVCKPGYNEIVTLDASNQWVYELQNLTPGQYVVDELDVDHEVTFIVDEGYQKDWAIVDVKDDAHVVKILNNMEISTGNVVNVSKRIVDAQGNQQYPSNDAQFTVVLASENDTQTITLTQETMWVQSVQLQPQTTYTIEEQNNVGYTVSYIVDDQPEASTAEIYTSGENQSVVILNRETTTQGNRMEISKLMKQANGTFIRPADGDEYEILIEGEGVERSVILNGGNGFHVVESNLPDGTYRVSEVANGTYGITYRIDGGEEVENAQVTLSNQSGVVVDVLNERLDNQNTMEIFKYMLESNGNYVPPNEEEVFNFRLTSDTVDQTYELNVQNNWHVTLTNYPNGTYRVEEVDSSYRVQYLVNGATLVDEAVFEASPSGTNIIGIINYRNSGETGTLQLQKKMRIQGELQDPQQDSFVIHIKGENYDKYVVLDEENGYQAEVMNLAFGTYELYEENARDRVTWQFNDEAERGDGVIDILDTQVQRVTIINTRDQSEEVQASKQDSIRIIM